MIEWEKMIVDNKDKFNFEKDKLDVSVPHVTVEIMNYKTGIVVCRFQFDTDASVKLIKGKRIKVNATLQAFNTSSVNLIVINLSKEFPFPIFAPPEAFSIRTGQIIEEGDDVCFKYFRIPF